MVRTGMTVSALCLAAAGTILLFLPDDASRVILPGDAHGSTLVQLLGAALLGFGAANWIARGSVLGGIYGRAVVAGNQTHLTIGALLLVKHGVEVAARHPAYWTLAGLYVAGAAFFAWLTFFSPGKR